MKLLQRFSSGHHVYNVNPNFNDKLLWNHNIKAQLFTESILTQFMISIKAFSWNHFMHLDHLP